MCLNCPILVIIIKLKKKNGCVTIISKRKQFLCRFAYTAILREVTCTYSVVNMCCVNTLDKQISLISPLFKKTKLIKLQRTLQSIVLMDCMRLINGSCKNIGISDDPTYVSLYKGNNHQYQYTEWIKCSSTKTWGKEGSVYCL